MTKTHGANPFFVEGASAIYDAAQNLPTNIRYPEEFHLHVWLNALCHEGITQNYISVIREDKYAEATLRQGGSKDFAVLYGVRAKVGSPDQERYVKCLDSQSGFDSPDFVTDAALSHWEENDD